MKNSKSIPVLLWLIVGLAAPFCLHAAEKPLAEKEKIEVLIKHIEGLKEATFVRNGSDYNSKTAARFLRRKYQAQAKEINTAMDFIEKIASVSSTSGRPYLIRFKSAHEVKCGDYLKGELKKLETNKTEKPKEPLDLE